MFPCGNSARICNKNYKLRFLRISFVLQQKSKHSQTIIEKTCLVVRGARLKLNQFYKKLSVAAANTLILLKYY